MDWKHLDTGTRSANENMALDSALLEDLAQEKCAILHLYDWEKDSVTYGHFIDPEKFLNMPGIEKKGLDLARRPTGGGIVFHNCDLAFSVLVPASCPLFSSNPLKNYAFVNERVLIAISKMLPLSAELLEQEKKQFSTHSRNFCMAKPTKYDVMIQKKKVGGAAQRKTRHGYLHQGSISLGFLEDHYLEEVLPPHTDVAKEMKKNSYALLGEKWTIKELREARETLRFYLQQVFSEQFAG